MTLTDLSTLEIARQVRTGDLRAIDVAQAYLERIDQFDEQLGTYLTIDREGALTTAAQVDQKIAQGLPVGALAGVPIGLKDLFVTKGLRTTCASKMLADWIPPYEGAHAERLRAADAVILGKLNMDEFAMGASTENSALRVCRNPWRTDCVPGGSSGGSAAAVAARLCAAALGSDTGGSIRQPASFCGVVGVKPTYGRVSRYGMVAFASSLDQAGPITHTVEESAHLLEVLAGHDPRDATSLDQPTGSWLAACSEPLKGLRIGVAAEYIDEGSDAEVNTAVVAAIETLKSLGASVSAVKLPHTQYAIATYYLICTAEASSNLARYDGVRFGLRAEKASDLIEMYSATRAAGFGPEVKRRIMLGTFALSAGYYDAYYARAQRVRTLIRRDFEQAFADCDLIVGPTSPYPAFEIGARSNDPLQMYLADVFTCPASLAGLPGLSLPCGKSEAGLPIGLQMIGPALAEDALFRAAAAYQRATDWHQLKPPLELQS